MVFVENELITIDKVSSTESTEQVNNLKSIFDNSNYVFVICGLDGQIKQSNSFLPTLLGIDEGRFNKEEAANLINNYVHPDDIQNTFLIVKETINGQRANKFENRYRAWDGSYKWLSWMLIPLQNKKEFYAIAHEITEQKELQENLEESNKALEIERKHLYSLLDGLPGLVYLQTNDRKIIYANNNFIRQYGEPNNQLCHDIIFDKNEPCSNCQLLRNIKTEIPEQYQTVIKDTIFEVHQHFFQDSEGRHLIVKQLIDITKKRLDEEEISRLDRLNLLGELAASIAHEVRNPMTTVRGFLQLLKGRDSLHQNAEYYALMIDELDRANSIITDFLSLAKTNKEQNISIKLNVLIDSVYPLILADALNQEKQVVLETKDVTEIYVNEKEIRQLILNLTKNGFESMSSGGVLKLMTYEVANGVVLAVQDQGSGIREDIIEKLGTAFITTKDGGTGLGLSTCYRIANKHNALIDIETSTLGSTFSIRFPI